VFIGLHKNQFEKNWFLIIMVAGSRETVETSVNCLAKMLEGLNK